MVIYEGFACYDSIVSCYRNHDATMTRRESKEVGK